MGLLRAALQRLDRDLPIAAVVPARDHARRVAAGFSVAASGNSTTTSERQRRRARSASPASSRPSTRRPGRSGPLDRFVEGLVRRTRRSTASASTGRAGAASVWATRGRKRGGRAETARRPSAANRRHGQEETRAGERLLETIYPCGLRGAGCTRSTCTRRSHPRRDRRPGAPAQLSPPSRACWSSRLARAAPFPLRRVRRLGRVRPRGDQRRGALAPPDATPTRDELARDGSSTDAASSASSGERAPRATDSLTGLANRRSRRGDRA